MANIFMMTEEIARGMVCFFHQKKHSYLINPARPPLYHQYVWKGEIYFFEKKNLQKKVGIGKSSARFIMTS
jgi:hypothetical protein